MFSNSATALIGARAAMGIGAAFVMPSTLSVLAHVFPPDERPKAIGVWAAFAGIGVALGGVISGWLLQHFWWGSIFLINVFVVIVALVAGYFLIPRAHEKRHAALDPAGAVLSILGLGALIYSIIEAPNHGWLSVPTVGGFALAIAILGSFGAWELRAAEPMLDLRFFRNPRFTAGASAITLIFFVMFGTFFVLSQYLQLVHGYSPLSAGVRILPWALAYMLSTTRAARLVVRFGQRRVVSSGMLIVAVGLAVLSRSGIDTNYAVRSVGIDHHGDRDGLHDRAVDRSDHAVAADGEGRRRLRSQRHHPRGGWRARRRCVRQHRRLAVPQLRRRIAGRSPVGRTRVARRRAASGIDRARRARCRRHARGPAGVRQRARRHAGRRRAGRDRGRGRHLVPAAPRRADRGGRTGAGRTRGGVVSEAMGASVDYPAAAAIELVDVLQAFADPVRLQIVRILDRSNGEMPCTDFQLELPVGKSTASHHLKVMREAGLVTARVEGTRRYYALRRDDLDARFPGLLDSVLRAEA